MVSDVSETWEGMRSPFLLLILCVRVPLPVCLRAICHTPLGQQVLCPLVCLVVCLLVWLACLLLCLCLFVCLFDHIFVCLCFPLFAFSLTISNDNHNRRAKPNFVVGCFFVLCLFVCLFARLFVAVSSSRFSSPVWHMCYALEKHGARGVVGSVFVCLFVGGLVGCLVAWLVGYLGI